jgi:uncharacterized protein RhaS with RHS repeats
VRFTYNTVGLNTEIDRYVDGVLGVHTTNSYDPFGRLNGISHANGAGQFSSSVDVIDGLNRLSAQVKDGQVRAIDYDKTDQVKVVTGSNSEAYSYDLNGNRIGGGYQTGADNRLLSDVER